MQSLSYSVLFLRNILNNDIKSIQLLKIFGNYLILISYQIYT